MLLWRIYFTAYNETYFCLHVKWPKFLSDFFPTDFYKNLRYKLHVNPSFGSRADTCRHTDMTKQMGASHDYAKTPKGV
jgi:hypothetical protein